MIKIASAHLQSTKVSFERKKEFNAAEEAKEICLILFTVVPAGVFDEVYRFLEYYGKHGELDWQSIGITPSEVAERYFAKRIREVNESDD